MITPDELDLHLAEIKEQDNRFYPGLALIVASGQRATAVQRSNYFEDEYFIGWYEGHPDHPETTPPVFIVEKDVIGLPDLSWGNTLGEYVGEGGLKIERWYADLETEVSKGDLIATVGAFALDADNPFTKEAVDEVESLDVEVCDDNTINLGIRSPHDGLLISRLDEYRHGEMGKLKTNRRKLHFESSAELPAPVDALADYFARYLEFLEKRASEEEAKRIAAEKRRLAAIKREEEKRKRREAERLEAERKAEEERKQLEFEEKKRLEEEERQRAIALKRAQEERARLKKLAVKKRAKQIYWQRLQRKTVFYGKRVLIGVGAVGLLVLILVILVNVDSSSQPRSTQQKTPTSTKAEESKISLGSFVAKLKLQAIESRKNLSDRSDEIRTYNPSTFVGPEGLVAKLLETTEAWSGRSINLEKDGTIIFIHGGVGSFWYYPTIKEGLYLPFIGKRTPILFIESGSFQQMSSDLNTIAAGLSLTYKNYIDKGHEPVALEINRSDGRLQIRLSADAKRLRDTIEDF
ncbi:MAG: hypothetical protein AAGH40_11070 [Verrucomicrobiota bacterium]